MTYQQLTQLVTKKSIDKGHPSSLMNASGTTIADDTDRNIKYYMYEFAEAFAKTRKPFIFIFNNCFIVEIFGVKNAPPSDTADILEDELYIPMLCVHYKECVCAH